jgi:hypothetical protein
MVNNRRGIYLIHSSGSKLYHNNFINNTQQAIEESGYNQWDNGYPSGGNYWSDFDEPTEGAYDQYHGSDQNISGPDGLIDLGLPEGGLNPYQLPGGGNLDRYPLMKPWHTPYIPRCVAALDL